MLPEINERKASVSGCDSDGIPKIQRVSVSSVSNGAPNQTGGDDDSASPGGSRRSSVTQTGILRQRRPSLRLTSNSVRGSSIQSTHGISLLSTGRRPSFRQRGQLRPQGSSPEEEKIELPQHPRFLALLSPEAQYSAMKCYEDIIYSEITELFPEYRNVVQRSSSPDNVHHLAIKSAGEENIEPTEHTEENTQALVTLTNKRQIMPYGRSNTDMTHNKLPSISKEKRLMMTYRFQSAMDILDSIRHQTGHLITSARPAAKTIDPVHYFNVWNSHWSKEFVIVNA